MATALTINRFPVIAALASLVIAMSLVSCSSSDETSSESKPEAPAKPAIVVPAGPVQVSETLEVTSKDGVLFDLKLALRVFDQNGSNGRRDDAEILTPDKTEYQGIFNDGPGTLFIVSCLADVCQGDDKTATFEVRYWVEELPDPLPAGVNLPGG